MLRSVSIENYALIDSLEISFDKGLSIITGETGAGKSILLGALSLILGQRADVSSLKDKEKSCVVEGVFSIDGYGLESLFEESDLDYNASSTFRRVINPNGKSRAFINDIPVTLNILKDITDRLIDIHSQHQNLLIANSGFQLWVVDLLANNTELLRSYKETFLSYKKTVFTLNELRQQHEQSKADYDYLLFQFNQLEEAKLKENEQEELEVELKQLTHAEEIKSGYGRAASILSGEEPGIVQMLHEAQQTVHRLIPLSREAEELAKRIESGKIEIQDIAREVERLEEAITFSPDRQAAVEERLDTIYSLEQKHRVGSVKELIEIRSALQEKISAIVGFDEQLEVLEKERKQKEEKLSNLSTELAEKREKVLPELERCVIELLRSLGIPSAIFRAVHAKLDDYTVTGNTSITFLFSANKDMSPQDIAKVASGGEMSRLMLSLKSLVAQSGKLPTIIFDEIDTGISGEVADKMGMLISQLAQQNQVVNITHLPQVASKGNAHYVVYKEDTPSSTQTRIRRLTSNERIMEIAKMLSGSSITEAAISNARELLGKV